MRNLVDAVLGAGIGLIIIGWFIAHQLGSWGRAPDLLLGVPWRASSTYPVLIAPLMFFHTDDEASPSITYEFPAPTALSSLVVTNSSWFPERAAPLVAEVSTDGTTFREVARREAIFTTWRPYFVRQQVRFLRLRAPHRTWLHLKRVEAHA